MHVRTFGRGYAAPRRAAPLRAGRLHLYTDVLGTEIWRDPLDSTRLAIIQFIGLSKAPVHAVFPDRSLSLPLFSLSFARSLSTLSLSFSLSRRAYAPSFSPFRIYLPSGPRPSLRSSRYNCLLSLVLSSRSSFPIFRLRSARCYPSLAAAWSLRGGERLGAIRCDNCP